MALRNIHRGQDHFPCTILHGSTLALVAFGLQSSSLWWWRNPVNCRAQSRAPHLPLRASGCSRLGQAEVSCDITGCLGWQNCFPLRSPALVLTWSNVMPRRTWL